MWGTTGEPGKLRVPRKKVAAPESAAKFREETSKKRRAEACRRHIGHPF
jgi:hypothetical protein